jgi:isoquinoline 1-oxidoreductase beta subunit
MILDHLDSQAAGPARSRSANELSRRGFLRAGTSLGGGLTLSLCLPLANGGAEAAFANSFAPNAFIRIEGDGRIILTMPYIEMGQGTYTSIPMLIAEELEVELNQVRLEHAPPNEKLYANPLLGVQATGNSNAIRGAWRPLRQAGAIARTMLVSAAAKRWKVDPAACRAQGGEVLHTPTGRSIKYGALAAAAAQMPIPKSVELKRPEDFRLIGTSAKRLDAPAKVDGSAVYGIDARPPGVMFATIAQSPVFGGRVKRVDDAAAKNVKGVRKIVRLDDAVAVVADHMGAAKKGLAALVVEWEDGPHAKLDTAEVARELERATLHSGVVAQNVGDADKAMASAVTKVEAIYEVPFLAHATMEPMNCTAHVREDRCDVWVGTQAIARVQAAAAKTAGLPLDKVVIHNHLIGGGFGRRLEVDGVVRAVQIAREVDGPVKVVWTREEDIQHDMYRPYFFDRISAGLDEKGTPVAWSLRFAGSSVIARWLPPGFKDGLDPDTTEGAINLVYALPNMRVEYSRVGAPGRSDGLLAQRRAVAQCLRDRKLHGRIGGGGEARRGRLPAGPSRQDAPRQGRPRARRAKSRLGTEVARRGWLRRLGSVRLRHLHGAGRRSRSVRRWRGSRAARRLRRRLRRRRQSRHRRGADSERDHVRRHCGALWRDHPQGRPRRASQLR